MQIKFIVISSIVLASSTAFAGPGLLGDVAIQAGSDAAPGVVENLNTVKQGLEAAKGLKGSLGQLPGMAKGQDPQAGQETAPEVAETKTTIETETTQIDSSVANEQQKVLNPLSDEKTKDTTIETTTATEEAESQTPEATADSVKQETEAATIEESQQGAEPTQELQNQADNVPITLDDLKNKAKEKASGKMLDLIR